jgi:starch-binding outer membrane protein, SusD/RagB family
MGTSSKNYDIQTPQNLTGYYIKKFDNADVAFKDYYSNSTSEFSPTPFSFEIKV